MPVRYATRSVVLLCVPIMVLLQACRSSPAAQETRYLKRGDALVAKKDYSRAILEFRSAAAAMPNDAEPHYRMGLAYLASGDLGSGARALQKAISLNPRHAGAQLKAAEIMTATRDQGLIKEAVSRLQAIYGNSPDNPEAIDTLALAEWKLGKPEDASKRLEEALKKFPGHLQSSVTLARMKLSKNDWNGAEEVLKKAVADAPQSAPAATALGELYAVLRQPEKAVPVLNRALELDPKNGQALLTLASIQVSSKQMDQAEQTYKRLSSLPEKSYRPLHAMFLYQIGKREAAITEFQALVKADPNDRDARSRLVTAYLRANRVSDAETLLAQALARNSKDADALLQRAELRLRLGKPDDAEKDLKDSLRFLPNSARVHLALAIVNGVKGLENKQREELAQSLQLDPTLLKARLALEMSFLRANQASAALDIIARAPEHQKQELAWIIGNNWAQMAVGQLSEAKAGIDRALKEGRPSEAVFQNAVLRSLQRDYPGALVQVEELIGRNEALVEVASLMMQIYESQREVSKGIERLRQIATTHPDSAPLQQLLGEWYKRTDNLAAAGKAFESAKSADPHFLAAELSLAELDIQQGRNDIARQKLNTVVATEPANVAAQLLAARADEAAGDRAAVITRYRAVLAVDNSNLLALNNLAYALAADNPDEALKFARQAAEKAPDNPYVQDTLGWVYYRKGLYSMAVRYLKTAVEKESTPRRQFHLGMSYLKSGDQATGQKFVKEALLKDPNLVKTEQGW